MKIFALLVLFLWTALIPLHAQDGKDSIRTLTRLANKAMKSDNYDQAIAYTEQWVRTAESMYGNKDSIYATGVLFLGRCFEAAGKYDTAKTLYFQALELHEEILAPNSIRTFQNKQMIGNLFSEIGPKETAERYLREIRDFAFKHYGAEHKSTINACHNLGAFYVRERRLEEAEVLLLQVLNMAKKVYGADVHPSYVEGLASLYLKKKEFKKAEAMYYEAKRIIEKKVGKKHSAYARTLNNIAYLYNYMKKYDLAEKLYKESLQIKNEILKPGHPGIATMHLNLGRMYTALERYEEALTHIEQAIAIYKGALGAKHPSVSRSISVLAEIFLGENKRAEALNTIYRALDANCLEARIDSTTPVNKMATEYVFQSYRLALNLWHLLAKSYFKEYETTGSLEALKQCFNIQTAMSIYIKRTHADMASIKDKLFLLETTTGIVRRASNSAYLLYKETGDKRYLEAVFSISEDNKSVALASALQSEQALNLGNVPQDLIAQEHMVNKQLATLYKKLADAQRKEDSVALGEITQALIVTKIEKDSLATVLENNYPKYNQLKYIISETDLDAIRAKVLDSETAMLEYLVQDTLVYVLLVRENAMYCHRINFNEGELKERIRQFRKSLSNYDFILKEQEEASALYKEMAFYFYKKLLSPMEAHLEGVKNLIVIPDGELGHIPFETFLSTQAAATETKNWRDLDYLINRFNISYSYSAALLLEGLKNERRANNGQIAAFAASYEGEHSSRVGLRSSKIEEIRTNLMALDAVEGEVRALEELLGKGAFFYGEAANEAAFKTTVQGYAIIHLAMHGLLDANEPMASSLVFTEDGGAGEDNLLAAYEIANLQLNAELVVLSACETGYGKFQQGEGVMSLARSFMYAGVPSLTVSLWQVNDNSTAAIMKYFYRNLVSGMPKDQALAEVKKEYIQVADGIIAHPAFWSPFIQLGNRDAITIKQQSNWWWFAIGGTLIALFAFWLRQRKNVEL